MDRMTVEPSQVGLSPQADGPLPLASRKKA
jgi:hypothetical protein